jgi:hypothetical protein
MDEGRFRQGTACGRSAPANYWRKGGAGVDASRSWQTAKGGQEGQSDAAAGPGRAGGISAGGERLAGAHQSGSAGEHVTAPEVRVAHSAEYDAVPRERARRGARFASAASDAADKPAERVDTACAASSGLGSLFGSDLDYLLRRG